MNLIIRFFRFTRVQGHFASASTANIERRSERNYGVLIVVVTIDNSREDYFYKKNYPKTLMLYAYCVVLCILLLFISAKILRPKRKTTRERERTYLSSISRKRRTVVEFPLARMPGGCIYIHIRIYSISDMEKRSIVSLVIASLMSAYSRRV